MPPARTILRGQTYSSVTDFTTSDVRRDLQKPYSNSINKNFLGKSGITFPSKIPIATSKQKGNSKKKNEEHNRYMDLDEFLSKADKDDSQHESDPDYPKPTVDLLASLLTLGKMIQSQKQFIKSQSIEKETNSTTDNPSSKNVFEHVTEPEKGSHIIKESSECSLESISDKMILGENAKTHSLNSSRRHDQSYEDRHSVYRENKEDKANSSSCSDSQRCVIPEDIKDIDYWDRRKRNNLAAKKSREERRKKELEVVETAKQLENENTQLTSMLKRLTSRNELLESKLKNIHKWNRTESVSLSSSAEES